MQKQFENTPSSAISGIIRYAEDGIEFSKRQERKYERAFLEESVSQIVFKFWGKESDQIMRSYSENMYLSHNG